jgi:solute carrier family 25 oxoglutarate transporter 11
MFRPGSGTIAGFFSAFCSLPADYVKTQMQRMRPGPDGKMPYTGSIDCTMKVRFCYYSTLLLPLEL